MSFDPTIPQANTDLNARTDSQQLQCLEDAHRRASGESAADLEIRRRLPGRFRSAGYQRRNVRPVCDRKLVQFTRHGKDLYPGRAPAHRLGRRRRRRGDDGLLDFVLMGG